MLQFIFERKKKKKRNGEFVLIEKTHGGTSQRKSLIYDPRKTDYPISNEEEKKEEKMYNINFQRLAFEIESIQFISITRSIYKNKTYQLHDPFTRMEDKK